MDRYHIRPRKVKYRCGPWLFTTRALADLLNFLASFWVVAGSVLTYDIILGCVLACMSTVLCWHAGPIEWDMSQNFISIAVVWPVTQGISIGFSRRESALTEFGNLLATMRSVWESLHTWQIKDKDGEWRRVAESFEDKESQLAYRRLFDELLVSIVAYFGLPRTQRARHTVGICLARAEEAEIKELLREQRSVVDKAIGRMRRMVQDMKVKGLPGGEAHRLDQYVSLMNTAFEKLVFLKEYRTPRALRSYARVYIILMGAFYAPNYLTIASSQSPHHREQLLAALLYACMLQIVVGSLFHVLIGLEDPFGSRTRGSECWSFEVILDGVNVPDLVSKAREQLAMIEEDSKLSWKTPVVRSLPRLSDAAVRSSHISVHEAHSVSVSVHDLSLEHSQ